MADPASQFRPAVPADADALADLVDMASDGLASYLWSKVAPPGCDPWVIGRARATREPGGISYRNAVVVERAGRVVAGMIGHPLADTPEAWPPRLPAMVVPLQELEDQVPGTWSVNVLAAYPEHRGKGYGTALLGVAELLARATHRRGLSIIVADTNVGARRLYERCGFRIVAERRMVKEAWQHPGTSFVLMCRRLAG
ncbi:MAG TPA: GNAT family N-acetyltransferase [Hyphomicrobiaceae bacterium]|nr:GNAT family N-acetyltransferase [Hyphomicrobiaceae bacterium]